MEQINVLGTASDNTIRIDSSGAVTAPIAVTGSVTVTGPTGATGATGAAGATGVGVPTGGSTGQVLAKNSATNYDTGWTTASVSDATFTTSGKVKQTVYNVRDYGAVGDGITLTDASMTTATTTITSATAAFTPADVGKKIGISGAGAAGVALDGTILTRISATQVTISATASTTVSGATVFYATNDTTAIQNCYAAVLANGGGRMYASSGVYGVTGLVFIISNFFFQGSGSSTIFKLFGNANTDVICHGDAVTACNNVHFADFQVDGNKVMQPASAPVGGERQGLRLRHDAQNCYFITVERVYAHHTMHHGISIESSAYCTVIENRCEFNAQNGIWWENSSNVSIINNSSSRNGGSGVRIFQSSDGSARGNISKSDGGQGLSVLFGANISVIGNTAYRSGWIDNTAADGFSLSLSNNITFIGNTAYGSYGHGMQLNGMTYSIIVGNTFRRNGQLTDNTYDDIRITNAGGGSANTNNVISSNTFKNDTGAFFSNRVAYNINIAQANSHLGNIFRDNVFGDPVTAKVQNLGSTDGTPGGADNYLGENVGLNPIKYYNYAYFNATQTITPTDGNVLYGSGYYATSTVTIANGIVRGQKFKLIFNQDSGGKQLAWAANVKWPGGKAPILSGVASSIDIFDFVWDGTNWLGSYSRSAKTYIQLGYLTNPITLDPSTYDVMYGSGYYSPTTVNISSGNNNGQQFTFIFNQDVGNKLITWGSTVKWPGGTAPTLSTAASTIDTMLFTWDGTYWNGLISSNPSVLALKAPLASPALTGTPTAPTAAAATNNTQIATTAYVDSATSASSAGLDVKLSVRGATTANITLSGAQTIDGVSIIAGDRVLVKNQSTGANNGIYVAASGAWSRSTDANTSALVTSGMFTFVSEGTANSGAGYVLTTADPITLGTTALVFAQFNAVGGVADASTSVKGIVQLTNDLGGTATAPTVLATHLSAALPVAQGGTGSTTQNFVDLTTAQTIAGVKSFSNNIVVPTTNTTIGNSLAWLNYRTDFGGLIEANGSEFNIYSGSFKVSASAQMQNGIVMNNAKALDIEGSQSSVGTPIPTPSVINFKSYYYNAGNLNKSFTLSNVVDTVAPTSHLSIKYDGTEKVAIDNTGKITTTGNLNITTAYAGGTFTNTATAQYSSAGFVLLNNTATMGNYAGVQIVSQISDVGGTVGEMVFNRVNTAGAYQSTLLSIGLNTNLTNFFTGLQVSGGNLTISKSVPELRIISSDAHYARITRADTINTTTQYNQVNKPAGSNNSMVLNGTTQRMDIPYTSIGTTISLELWFKYTSGTDLFSYASSLIRISTTNITWFANTTGASNVTSQTISTGAWHHLAVTQTGTTYNLYFDGSQIVTNGTSIAVGSGNTSNALGSYSGSLSYSGEFDEVRIYSKVLTSAEVTAHYNAGSGTYGAAETSLEFGYHLDGDASDYSGNARTGTLVGTPTFSTGKVTQTATLVEVPVWSSTDGVAGLEEGIHTFGTPVGGFVAQGQTVKLKTNTLERLRIDANGNVGIGQTTLTAGLHLPASSTSYASIRIPSGTAPTSPNDGDVWYDGTHLKIRISATTYQLDQQTAGTITRTVSSISSPTTAGATASTDYVYFVSGTTTLTLPTAVANTSMYRVKNSGVNTVTVATTASQTIDGSTTITLVPNSSVDIISNNTNWGVF